MTNKTEKLKLAKRMKVQASLLEARAYRINHVLRNIEDTSNSTDMQNRIESIEYGTLKYPSKCRSNDETARHYGTSPRMPFKALFQTPFADEDRTRLQKLYDRTLTREEFERFLEAVTNGCQKAIRETERDSEGDNSWREKALEQLKFVRELSQEHNQTSYTR